MEKSRHWLSQRIAGLYAVIALAFPACTTQPPAAESSTETIVGQELVTRRTRVMENRESAAETYRQEHADDLPATAQDVIDRYLEAVGGRDGFDSIQTLVVRTRHVNF